MLNMGRASLLRTSPRLIQIVRVLTRHKFLGALRGKNHWPSPQEVRETFEKLGLTFLKLGQVLAMRRDLLSDAYINEVEKLHDQLPVLGFDAVRDAVELEFSAPLSMMFSSFSETPLAAAPIRQVHEATLHDGRHVAVKVKRPDLETIITTDRLQEARYANDLFQSRTASYLLVLKYLVIPPENPTLNTDILQSEGLEQTAIIAPIEFCT